MRGREHPGGRFVGGGFRLLVGRDLEERERLYGIISNAGRWSFALVVVLVIYMLINREKLRNRFLWLFGEGHMTVTTRALDDAAQGLSRFLLNYTGQQ